MNDYQVSHLDELESEAIYVIREVAANFQNPVILFSGGKDSIVLSHLAGKAFYPAKIPFSFVHVDTGHNFPETMVFRDDLIQRLGVKLIVGSVEEAIGQGLVMEETGKDANRNLLQIETLLNVLKTHQIDAAMGGARRDEEVARAKERFFSHRDMFGQWNPKSQRPELWHLFNTRCHPGEHFRVFPISNWTEMDIWSYIKQEGIELPSLYFSHSRKCVERNGQLLAVSDYLALEPHETIVSKKVRFRTCGDMTITGAWESEAQTVDDVILELASANRSERGGRVDDKRSTSAMEDRKKLGYF